jgi:hypothetical protein
MSEHTPEEHTEAYEANARRIVACVNACAGIRTVTLEAEALADSLVVLHDLLRKVHDFDPADDHRLKEVERDFRAALAKLRASHG